MTSSDDDADPADVLPEEVLLPEQRESRTTAANPPNMKETETETDEKPNETLNISSHREFVERQRLEDIIVAQRNAREALADAGRLEIEASGGRDSSQATQYVNEHIAGQVWGLVAQLEPLLRRTDLGEEYWSETPLVDLALPGPTLQDGEHVEFYTLAESPDRLLTYEHESCPDNDADYRIEVAGKRSEDSVHVSSVASQCQKCRDGAKPEAPKLSLVGLRDYLELGGSVTVRYATTGEKNLAPARSSTLNQNDGVNEETLYITRSASREAYRLAQEFLADLGLALEPEVAEETEIDLDEFR